MIDMSFAAFKSETIRLADEVDLTGRYRARLDMMTEEQYQHWRDVALKEGRYVNAPHVTIAQWAIIGWVSAQFLYGCIVTAYPLHGKEQRQANLLQRDLLRAYEKGLEKSSEFPERFGNALVYDIWVYSDTSFMTTHDERTAEFAQKLLAQLHGE